MKGYFLVLIFSRAKSLLVLVFTLCASSHSGKRECRAGGSLWWPSSTTSWWTTTGGPWLTFARWSRMAIIEILEPWSVVWLFLEGIYGELVGTSMPPITRWNWYQKVCGIRYDFLIKFEHLAEEEEYLRRRLRLEQVIGPRLIIRYLNIKTNFQSTQAIDCLLIATMTIHCRRFPSYLPN